MKSKDRNDSSGETPKDDASSDRKRKQRIPKKGWSPPPFDAFAEADRSRAKRGGRTGGDRPTRSFSDKPAPGRGASDKPAFGERPKRAFGRDDAGRGTDAPRRTFGRGGEPTEGGDRPKRTFKRDGEGGGFADRPKRAFGKDKPAFGERPKRAFGRDDAGRGTDAPRRAFGRGGEPTEGGERPKRTFKRDGEGGGFADRPKRAGFGTTKSGARKPFDQTDRRGNGERTTRTPARDNFKGYGPKGIRGKDGKPARAGGRDAKASVEEVRLNKYIAHSGVCARREADDLIASGKVKVNGKVVMELGSKVKTSDKVMVNDMTIQFEPFKYVLMHKPKNTITTTSDEKGRKTVMDLIESEIGERLYPVGRLDRNTTGVLLLTNDGDLANRLMHPSYSVGKVYQAELNRVLSDADLEQLKKGVELEDGPAKAYYAVRGVSDQKSIELAVHEGRNHLVRRMVEALGAEVIKLKRSQFAGLELDDLRPGRWRFLKSKEVNILRTKVKLPELRK